MSQTRTHRRVTFNPAEAAPTMAAFETPRTRVLDSENIYRTEQYEDEDGYDR